MVIGHIVIGHIVIGHMASGHMTAKPQKIYGWVSETFWE